MRNAEFNDPRLVQVYDTQCRWSSDDDLFLALANETPGSRVLDLGCGTGRLTLALAGAGHTVMGIDPARASLEAARLKPGAEQVTWIEGTAAAAPADAFDLALMTSHVAQFITGDEEWQTTLAELNRALVPGGRLIFESRDPAARAWESWAADPSADRYRLPDGSGVEVWTEVTEVLRGELSGPLVTFVHHYSFSASPEERLSRATLRFRTEETLRSSLGRAGFEVEHLFGGWHREPVGQGDGEFIVVARASGRGQTEKPHRSGAWG